MEELRRSTWDAIKNNETCYVNQLFDDIGFPALVTLSPDPMLSGKLRYCLNKQRLSCNDDGGGDGGEVYAFKIGRSLDSDLELDGVGICARHCNVKAQRIRERNRHQINTLAFFF